MPEPKDYTGDRKYVMGLAIVMSYGQCCRILNKARMYTYIHARINIHTYTLISAHLHKYIHI